ncbi:MAG TPA: ABC transporter substrate-binding protein [Chloroflexota bacterium]|nr:ABC transporter substrate-binding protein [Chloroflexota bacterium]
MTKVSRRAILRATGVVGLGLLAGCGRLPGQTTQIPRIGVLRATNEAFLQEPGEAFTQALQELGYVEGRTIIIERRPADGVADLLQPPVDVIVAAGTLAIRVARDATSTIPIIMVLASEPVRQGFVASLARPGGNLTGLSVLNVQLTGKKLELLRDTVPAISTVAFLWNPAIPDRAYELEELDAATQALALRALPVEARAPEDLDGAIAAAARTQPGALLLQNSALNAVHQARIADLAARHSLATMSGFPEFPSQGGLMGYGPNRAGQWRQAAGYVDRILKGTKPADLPVEQPREFEFVINLQTARALGLTIPQHVLLQATEVIR